MTRDALCDAIGVAVGFNIIDRIADSLGFTVPPAEVFARAAPIMLKRGYKLV